MPVKYVCSKCGAESESVSADKPAAYMTLSLPSGKFDLCATCQLALFTWLDGKPHAPEATPEVPQALANAATANDQGDQPRAIDTPGPVPEVVNG